MTSPLPTTNAPPGPPPGPPPESLRRDLSLVALAALAINSMIGAGIFGLPAGAARLTGLFSPVLFLICGLLMATLMLSFAQASSYFRGTGGPILYATAAFGPFAGFQSGWLIYIGRATAVAANSNLFATYLGTYIPWVNAGAGRVTVILLIAAGFAWLNIRGVKRGMGAILAISVAKFVPLVLFVLVGLTQVDFTVFANVDTPAMDTLGEAALLVFYAFVGFEGALIPAGESRNPERDIPRALLITAVAGTSLYVGIQLVSVGVLPTLASSTRPLADAAEVFMGAAGVAMLTFAAMASILGNLGSSVLSAPRMTYALARGGSLPALLGDVHPQFNTPHISILLFLLLSVGLGVAGTFTQLAVMSSLARLVAYAIGLAALPRLRARYGAQPNAMQLPGGLTVPVAGFAICLWLMSQVQFAAVWQTGAFMAVGTVMYVTARRGRAKDAPL